MENGLDSSRALSLKTVLRLARWPNLVIIIGIQIGVYLGYVSSYWQQSSLSCFLYLTLVILMTVAATLCGYVINEIMDRDADRINERINVLNTSGFLEKQLRQVYFAGVGFGVLCTIFLTTWSLHFLWIYALTTILLWVYSVSLKRLPLIGNTVISVFCALVIVIVWHPVLPMTEMPTDLWLLTGFAFLITLIREIVKDIEDIFGDSQVGDRTLPIIAGIPATKTFVCFLALTCISGLLFVSPRASSGTLVSFGFWLATMSLLTLTPVYLVFKAKSKTQYHTVSTLLKVSMITGMLYIVL